MCLSRMRLVVAVVLAPSMCGAMCGADSYKVR
jgi:hypothetical protein